MTCTSAFYGCAGLTLTAFEKAFFADVQPAGLILFARNCETPAQVAALTASFRAAVGRDDAAVLIDQEGGRVQRIKPPQWRSSPAARRFGELARQDLDLACKAARLNANLIGLDLKALGVTINCAPCLDVFCPDTHDAIGDRSYSDNPAHIVALGQAVMDGLLEVGIWPVIKHLPGHGRAKVDSHLTLPVVDASLDELRARDFIPFKQLGQADLGMTVHICFTAIDPDHPATQSKRVIDTIIRGELGFQGLLMTDDIGMKALGDDFEIRSRKALQAGCDLILYCKGVESEMRAVARAAHPLDSTQMAKLDHLSTLKPTIGPSESTHIEQKLRQILDS